MIANVILAATTVSDQMVAGAAMFAMVCGVVLMGGRSVIALPLRILQNCFKGQKLGHEAAVVAARFDRKQL